MTSLAITALVMQFSNASPRGVENAWHGGSMESHVRVVATSSLLYGIPMAFAGSHCRSSCGRALDMRIVQCL
jgi:hypothetical protein